MNLPHLKYFICDIPPALYLAKTYLEKYNREKEDISIAFLLHFQ